MLESQEIYFLSGALLHKLVRLLTSITLKNPERATLTKELQKGIESIGEKMDNTIAIEN